jgi:AraC family transcriptional activator of pobA
MALIRVIPNYDLYGDSSRLQDAAAFNFEWIPQRSSLYNWLIDPHRHDSFIQVLYLTQGHVTVQMDGVQQTLHAPCLMLIPAGHVHGFHFSQDTQGPVVTAMQKALESAAAVMMPPLLETIRTPRLLSLQLEMRYIEHLMPLFLALEQESHTTAEGQVAAGTSLLLALLVQVHRICSSADWSQTRSHYSISRKARQIEKFRSLIDKHFRTVHSLQIYANQVGVTVGQLSRLCREMLGKSSLQVINDRLIQEAQRELLYTALPIKQLAAELGFDDDAYFSRFFRKHSGMTPKAYRASSLATMGLGGIEPDQAVGKRWSRY